MHTSAYQCILINITENRKNIDQLEIKNTVVHIAVYSDGNNLKYIDLPEI